MDFYQTKKFYVVTANGYEWIDNERVGTTTIDIGKACKYENVEDAVKCAFRFNEEYPDSEFTIQRFIIEETTKPFQFDDENDIDSVEIV